jgi:hypothetical protein
MDSLQPGKLVAGRWRVVSELYSSGIPRYRVSDSEGTPAEMFIFKEVMAQNELMDKLSDLKHENFVRPLEIGKWLNYSYYVRELVTMEPLSDWHRRNKPLEEEQAIAIACQLCLAIEELERRKVDSLEVSAASINITIEGLVKVDPVFQALNRTEEVSASGLKHSLYQTGALIVWLLLGEDDDISAETSLGILEKAIKKNLISEQLTFVLQRALSQDPHSRHVSGEELLQELNQVLAAGEDYNYNAQQIDQPPQWHEDKRFWLYTAVALAGLLVVLMVLQSIFFK